MMSKALSPPTTIASGGISTIGGSTLPDRTRNQFIREMNNDIYSVIMSFLDVMNSTSFYSFLYQKYNDQSDELLKFIFPSLYHLNTSTTTTFRSSDVKQNKINYTSELNEITFILHCLGLLNQLKSAVTFNSLPPLEVFSTIDLYKECENYINLLELIKNEYIYNKKVDHLKLFKFVMNLDCLAKYIGYGLSHFNLKTKSLKDSYFTTFSALPFLKKVKETLLEKFEPIPLCEKYHIPITSREMKETLNQITFRSNKYISSFYYSTYGYSICMEIIRITEHEVMEEDFINILSNSFKLNFLKDLHIWIDFRKIKNEKLFFEQLHKLISMLNKNLNLLYLDINYYENEDQIVKFMDIFNSIKKNLNHLTLSTYTEVKDIDPFVKISKLDFTHNIKHLTLMDKNNFNLLNRLIFKNASNSENSKLEQLTISNIDYLYLFLNSHTSLKRLNFYGNLNNNETFNDTNLIKESFMNLKSLDTVFIDDRNESLGYSVLGNMGIYINNIIFKYSKNGYTLSSLIECFKRHSRRVNKLTIIDNTNFGTNIQLLCKIVSSFLFDNILNQLVIHTRHVSLLNELTFSIHHMFSPTELELKYLQIVKKLNSIDFILFIGKSNNFNNTLATTNTNNVTITITHSIPISGDSNIKDEISDKRAEIESVMSNVCILGSSVKLDQVDIHTFRPPFNHYLFYRFLHSLSFSNNLTLTRSSLYQLMIVK